MDRRPMTDGGAFREDHGDGSGVRHVRRRGHPPDGPRPRTAVLLLLPHLYGGLHRTGEGDPQAPMARPLQPRVGIPLFVVGFGQSVGWWLAGTEEPLDLAFFGLP